MIKVSSLSLLFASALLVAACGDSEGTGDDAGVVFKDQGTNNNPDGNVSNPDGNVSNPDGNVSNPDTGVNNPDGGVVGECNPVNDTNCQGDQTCRLNLGGTPPGPECRDVIGGPVAYLASCAGAPDSCAPGLTCLDVGEGAVCLKICFAGNNADCNGLGNDPNGYGCVGPLQQANQFGICLPNLPACQPWNDMCEAGNYCEYTGGANDFGCIQEGTSQAGATCSPQNPCMKGSMCLDFGSGATCMPPCNPADGAGCNPATEVCGTIVDQNNQQLPFGVCTDAPTECTILPDNCPTGEYCQAYQDGNFCSTEGSAQVGQTCSAQNLCQRGAVCGQNAQQQVVCLQVCDTTAPACNAGTCMDTGGGFGVCI